jgi:hypothetical protein
VVLGSIASRVFADIACPAHSRCPTAQNAHLAPLVLKESRSSPNARPKLTPPVCCVEFVAIDPYTSKAWQLLKRLQRLPYPLQLVRLELLFL